MIIDLDGMEGKVVRSGQSTGTVYDLETRLFYKGNPPISAGGMTIDGEWRKVRIFKTNIGVPNHLHDKQAVAHGYIEHDAAMALAYWLIAEADKVDIEVRLVEHEFASTHKVTRIKNKTVLRTYNFQKDMEEGKVK